MLSTEGVRESFDSLENEIAADRDKQFEGLALRSNLTTARYRVAASREIAVQLARIADTLNERSAA